MKFWQSVLESQNPSPPLYIAPAFLIAFYMFWNKSKDLMKIQMGFFHGIVNLFTGPLKNTAALIFGFPTKDRFFKYKMNPRSSSSVARKLGLFLTMITKYIVAFIVRLLLIILGVKYILKYTGKQIEGGGLPDIKDVLLLPVVIFKVILQAIFNSP